MGMGRAKITASGSFPGGLVCELPEGADLQICGDGFSDHTVKARAEIATILFSRRIRLRPTKRSQITDLATP
jgi:hypothetical protein